MPACTERAQRGNGASPADSPEAWTCLRTALGSLPLCMRSDTNSVPALLEPAVRGVLAALPSRTGPVLGAHPPQHHGNPPATPPFPFRVSRLPPFFAFPSTIRARTLQPAMASLRHRCLPMAASPQTSPASPMPLAPPLHSIHGRIQKTTVCELALNGWLPFSCGAARWAVLACTSCIEADTNSGW